MPEVVLTNFTIHPNDSGPDHLEKKLDQYVIDLLRSNGIPEYEWDRPVSFSGNLWRLVKLKDIKRGKTTYVGGGQLLNLPLDKQCRLVVARMKHCGGIPPPLGNGCRYGSAQELEELMEAYDPNAYLDVKNVIGTCRSILIWFEKYYQPENKGYSKSH